MTLSVGTIGLFVFLIPGFLFKFFIYHRSLIKRPLFADNAIHSIVSIIIYTSISVGLGSVLFLLLLSLQPTSYHARLIPHHGPVIMPIRDMFDALYQEGMTLSAISHLIGLLTTSCLTAVILGNLVRFSASKFLWVRAMIFGPLALLYKSSSVNLPTAFVLTKLEYKDKRIIYAGHAEEIGLGTGSTVDYIVLRNPHKFYLRLTGDFPTTTYKKARRLGGTPSKHNLLFISKADVENIHFQDYVFEMQDKFTDRRLSGTASA